MTVDCSESWEESLEMNLELGLERNHCHILRDRG